MIPEYELQALRNPLTNQRARSLVPLWFKHHSAWTTLFSPSRWYKSVPQGILDLQEFAKNLPDNDQPLTPDQIRTLYLFDVMRTYRASRSTQDTSSHASQIYKVVREDVRQSMQQELEAKIQSDPFQQVSDTWEEVRKTKDFLKVPGGRHVDFRVVWGPTTIGWVKAQNDAVKEAFVTAFEEAKNRRVEARFFEILCVTEGNCAERVDAAIRWAVTLMTLSSHSTPASNSATASPSNRSGSHSEVSTYLMS